jgi:hypothetical protein
VVRICESEDVYSRLIDRAIPPNKRGSVSQIIWYLRVATGTSRFFHGSSGRWNFRRRFEDRLGWPNSYGAKAICHLKHGKLDEPWS